ncbi:MAG: SulP family inorganic anion transporter [Paracoccaceae bacterium]
MTRGPSPSGALCRTVRPDFRLAPDEHLSPARLRIESSGLTVALALVPEAVLSPSSPVCIRWSGLYAAFLVGLVTALIGGRPGMISGATGALAVVMVALVAEHGVEYLATVVLMGVLAGHGRRLHWGKFIRLVPHPVMLGFVNGLAIVIFLAQLGQFKVPGTGAATGMARGRRMAPRARRSIPCWRWWR